jgi:SP family arabinose:H+ symporter-like MFS transporter
MKQKNPKYLLFISLVAALGGLLFGFDIGIITGAGPFFTKTFGLSHIQVGWAYSSLLFGAIAGAAFVGRVTDTLGRKKILFFVALLFLITSLWSAIAASLSSLVMARIVGGLAVGAASMVTPIYISEIAPAKYRGSLVSMYQLFIVTGILISYLINYLLRDIGEDNWRWMFATGAMPSALFFILLFFVPETPRFLFKKNKKELAKEVLVKIGGEELALTEMDEINQSFKNTPVNFRALFDPSMRKVLWVGFVLGVFVQLSGINTIIDYAPKIFESAGWGLDTGLFATFGLGIVNFVSTWVSILIIDRYGRRPLYIIGSTGMAMALLGLALAGFMGQFSGILVMLLIMMFIIFFGACVGPVFWTYMSEIFPNRIRGTAMSVPVFTQWVFNAIIVLVFPVLLNKLDTGPTFSILAFFAFWQLFFVIRNMKETKGKSLEEIEQIWRVDLKD